MKNTQKIGALAIALSIGMMVNAQQGRNVLSANQTDLQMYQDTVRKDTVQKDTTSKDSLMMTAPVAVAFFQDTAKKDTTKKDTTSMMNSVAVALYQDTTKKDTTKKDTTGKDTTNSLFAKNKVVNFSKEESILAFGSQDSGLTNTKALKKAERTSLV